ncbi:rhomboid family intramembrane serine protease [soil metagenome]
MSSSPLSPTEEPESSGLSRLVAVAPGVAIVVAMVAVMWSEEIVDLVPGTPFNRWGIRPRSMRGLLGIVLAPFLHVSFPHLIGNTIPFLLLGAVIALGGTRTIVEVTVIAGVVSGLGVWLFGASNSVHLGASGLVFGYLTYLVTRGVFARRVWWIVGGLITLAFYGGLFWGLLPRLGVSWLGHLFGAIGGVLAAYVLHAQHDLVDDDSPDAKLITP